MPKLHLVGITPDNRGLLLSEHARSKRGDLVLEIDDKLLEAIDRAHRQLQKEEGRGLESAALPTKRDDREDVPGARLTPREIQHRLRLGESVAALAKASGTEESWIDRFAAPVLAEQARIVDRATVMVYKKPRVGPSALPLVQSVAANVFDKGATLTMDEIDEGWSAHMRPEGVWCVTFTFSHKGRRHLAEWDVDIATSELTARNRLAGDLGYRESGRPMRAPEPAPAQTPVRPAPVKKTVVKKPATGRGGARPVPQTLPGTSTETSPDAGAASGVATDPGPVAAVEAPIVEAPPAVEAAPAVEAPPAVEPPSDAPPAPAAPSAAVPPSSAPTAGPESTTPAAGPPSRVAPPAQGSARPSAAARPPNAGRSSTAGRSTAGARPTRAGGGRDPLGRRALFSPPPAEGEAETGAEAAGPPGDPEPAGAAGAVSLASRPAPTTTPPAPRPTVTATPPAQRVVTGAQVASAAAKPAAPAKKAAAKKATAKKATAKKATPRKPAAKKPAATKKPAPAKKAAPPAQPAAPPAPPAGGTGPVSLPRREPGPEPPTG